ncbi:hypothetical protein [Zwartia sp.]|uniref:hypothetical protein n=1 Tax=Zwartia sp. TaxID=2978004 RepID=UPI003BAE89E0
MEQHDLVLQRFAKAFTAGLYKKFGKVPSTSVIADSFNDQAIGVKGITRETARRWLRGSSYPETDRLQLLIDWLELNPADILLNKRALDPTLTQSLKDENLSDKKSVLFAQQALDALSAQIAILDKNGNIIQVNRSWRKFAESNSTHDVPNIESFTNYLHVCDQVRGEDKHTATMMAAGIRAVLDDTINEFAMKYACHSPIEKRWFVARSSGFVLKKNKFVVVSHEMVSEKNWLYLEFPSLL